MAKLAIVVLTKNEEKNIKAVIANARQCTEEVIVLDSGSTDKTLEIAMQEGATTLFRAWTNDFAAQRNFVLDKTEADWLLYLDADERLSDELINAIKLVAASKNMDKQYVIKRCSYAFGQKFKHGVLRPDRVARLFPRDKVSWESKVHERPICSLKAEELPGYIEHYTYESWQQYFGKFNQYTSLWAEEAYKKGKRTKLAGAFAHAAYAFIQMTFFKRGILDGWLGLALCCNHFSYTLTKYLKLKEIQEKDKE
ncbi:MAG: glycosyltransferase family 2 protein [Acidaminococcaceae bacterium]